MNCVATASARGAWLGIALLLPLCWAASPAHAQFEVKSPVVEKGVLELEALGSVQSRFNDDDDDEEAEEAGEEVEEGGEEAGGGEEAEGDEEALEPEQEEDDLGSDGGEDDDDDEKQRQGYEFSVGYGVTDYLEAGAGPDAGAKEGSRSQGRRPRVREHLPGAAD